MVTDRSWARSTCICTPRDNTGKFTKNSAHTCAGSAMRVEFSLRCGRQMRSASAWSAISTVGMAASIQCANSPVAACGNYFCRACQKVRITNSRSERNWVCFCSRATRLRSSISTANRPVRSSTTSSATSGATTNGWKIAGRKIGREVRSVFTKCISARGDVASMKATGTLVISN